MIVFTLLGIKEKVPIIFSFKAVFETLLLIGVAYFLTAAQNLILVLKQSISELSKHNQAKQMNHNKITFEEVILGILGIILIISGITTLYALYITMMHLASLCLYCLRQ